MGRDTSFYAAAEMRYKRVTPADTETLPLWECAGRVLREDFVADYSIPPFDRSPYDGYALRAADTASATKESPVALKITEEIPAGSVPHVAVTAGTAAKILTGAPIPEGADAVIQFEKTVFTDTEVIISETVKPGRNIVTKGEDVTAGTILCKKGTVIDAGIMGSLAGQSRTSVKVYRKPKIGIISTGSELLDVGNAPQPGKIINSNLYTLSRAIGKLGCIPCDYGIAGDNPDTISALLAKALSECDAVISTGGVSVGDYDYTQQAMESAGCEILFSGVNLKPGMACCYGTKDGKLAAGLSGNPASSLTNFYAVTVPALKKLCGRADCFPEEYDTVLLSDFPKKSMSTRLLRGHSEIVDGRFCIRISEGQGNVVISGAIGCNMLAIVPAGSGKLSAGCILKGFFIDE